MPSNCVQYDKNAEGRLLCMDVMRDLLDEDALALYKVTKCPLKQYKICQVLYWLSAWRRRQFHVRLQLAAWWCSNTVRRNVFDGQMDAHGKLIGS